MCRVLTTLECTLVSLLIICSAKMTASVKNVSLLDSLHQFSSCENSFYQCLDNRRAQLSLDTVKNPTFSWLALASDKSFPLIFMLVTLVSVVIFSTLYDVRTRGKGATSRNQLLLSFSLHINAPSLMNMDQSRPSDAINCLHGIRALSILSLIFFHGYFYKTFSPYGKSAEVVEWKMTRYASSVSSMNVFVDSYFVISAALTTRTMLKELDSGRFNIFKTVFQRYMRLTPSVAAVIIFNKALAYYLNPNPSPEFLNYSVTPCEKNWWYALLHLQVYTNPREMCMHTTWYLSVEWQMTIFVAPILVFALWKFGQALVVPLIKLLIVLSCLYGFKVSYQNEFNAKDLNLASNIYEPFYDEFYYPTHIRGSPFLIGIILGYHLYTRDQTRRGHGKILRTFMSIFAFMLITGPMSISVIYDVIGENLFMNSFLIATIRTLWGIVIAWVIYMCQSGGFSFINKFLSYKYWMPIGKLGFTLYLVHPVLQYNNASFKETKIDLELTSMLIGFIKDLLMALVFSVILHFLVEQPFSLVGKYVTKDWNTDKKKIRTNS